MNKIKEQVFLSLKRTRIRLRRSLYCRGQTLVEYALIISVISIVAIGALINLGQHVNSLYSMIDSQVAIAQASH